MVEAAAQVADAKLIDLASLCNPNSAAPATRLVARSPKFPTHSPATSSSVTAICRASLPRPCAPSSSDHRARDADLSFISVELDNPGAYGRVVRDAAGKVAAIVEARDATPAQLAIK